MAFVVLFSTLSFTVESHYCGDYLIDTAVFTKVKVCGGNTIDQEFTMKDCCKHEVEVVKGQDKLKLNTFDDLDIQHQLFLTSFTYSYVSLFVTLPKQVVLHEEYRPPNLILDIQVLDETFLI